MTTLRNKVSLIGKVLSMCYTDDPIPTINIALEVKENKKKSSFPITATNKTAVIGNNHLVPGTSVLIEGQLVYSKTTYTDKEDTAVITTHQLVVDMYGFLILPNKKKKK